MLNIYTTQVPQNSHLMEWYRYTSARQKLARSFARLVISIHTASHCRVCRFVVCFSRIYVCILFSHCNKNHSDSNYTKFLVDLSYPIFFWSWLFYCFTLNDCCKFVLQWFFFVFFLKLFLICFLSKYITNDMIGILSAVSGI